MYLKQINRTKLKRHANSYCKTLWCKTQKYTKPRHTCKSIVLSTKIRCHKETLKYRCLNIVYKQYKIIPI